MLEELAHKYQAYDALIEGARFEILEVLGPPAPACACRNPQERGRRRDGAYAPRKAFSAAASSAPSSPRGNRWP
jgi:hypothetical protein